MTIAPDLLQRVSRADPKAANALAQLIWDAVIPDLQVVTLLQDPNRNIRGSVAWAVDDAGRPPMALAYLIDKGVTDENDYVRMRALLAATTHQGMDREQVAAYLRPHLNDPSPKVRRMIELTLAGQGRMDSPASKKKK